MIDSLKAFLEAIGLFCWSNTVANINDGSGTFLIQIQVRRRTRQAAKAICDELFSLLDSRLDEESIQLTESKWCIARPRCGAVILDLTAQTTTYYCEIALWGEN